ncbi:unnamed protein product [Menidia menidia]|uniref:(Atlantic silverside) hypothetical protein n=1 Tax=Menidia menidia TaxID=238744 RepID=A0A8S4BAU6_9TELE|nr:unnamed protein product [Menidia menidia]
MHQTFDPNRIVADSRRQVNNHNVCLTVDCLFYEGKLLKCSRNDVSWGDIQKLLNIPISEAPKDSIKYSITASNQESSKRYPSRPDQNQKPSKRHPTRPDQNQESSKRQVGFSVYHSWL